LRLLFTFLALTCATPSETTIEFKSLKQGVLEERLRLADPDVTVRYGNLRALFEKTGCGDLDYVRTVARSGMPERSVY